jgi:hypothetical protein
MAANFIGGGNQSIRRKPPTCRKSLKLERSAYNLKLNVVFCNGNQRLNNNYFDILSAKKAIDQIHHFRCLQFFILLYHDNLMLHTCISINISKII